MSDKMFSDIMGVSSVQEEGKKTLDEISKMIKSIGKFLGKLRLLVKNDEGRDNE